MVKESGISVHLLRKYEGLSRPTQNRAKRYTYFPRNESWSKQLLRIAKELLPSWF